MYTIILNSGKELNNIVPSDKTKNLIGLFNWAVSQQADEVISFIGGSVKTSQIAAILEEVSYDEFQ